MSFNGAVECEKRSATISENYQHRENSADRILCPIQFSAA